MRKPRKAILSALLALALLLTAGCAARTETSPEPTAEPTPESASAPAQHTHEWRDGVCAGCGKVCEHRWENGVCRICGTVCLHRMEGGVCEICGFGCEHAEHDPDTGICRRCGQKTAHSFVNGVCTRCGRKPQFINKLIDVPRALSVAAGAHGTTETFHYPLNEGAIVPGAHGTKLPEDRKQRDMIVYLPAGYDPGAQYDVLILVPGAGHNVHYWTQWPNRVNSAIGRITGVELLDRMIENGLIEPMIVVAVEYYLSGTPEEIAVPFEKDLRERVLPFLAANYATYASVGEDGSFIPAPEHFGYIAASFGAMIGWQMLPNTTDLFSYWSLLSGAFQNDDMIIQRINEGVDAAHPIHWLYAGDGLMAQGWTAYQNRIDELNKSCACLNKGGNLSFLTVEKSGHGLPTWDVGLINSLQVFFRSRFVPELLETTP